MAFIRQAQLPVTGEATLSLYKGNIDVASRTSPAACTMKGSPAWKVVARTTKPTPRAPADSGPAAARAGACESTQLIVAGRFFYAAPHSLRQIGFCHREEPLKFGGHERFGKTEVKASGSKAASVSLELSSVTATKRAARPPCGGRGTIGCHPLATKSGRRIQPLVARRLPPRWPLARRCELQPHGQRRYQRPKGACEFPIAGE